MEASAVMFINSFIHVRPSVWRLSVCPLEVSHKHITQPSWQQTSAQQQRGVALMLDTCKLDFLLELK